MLGSLLLGVVGLGCKMSKLMLCVVLVAVAMLSLEAEANPRDFDDGGKSGVGELLTCTSFYRTGSKRKFWATERSCERLDRSSSRTTRRQNPARISMHKLLQHSYFPVIRQQICGR